MPGVDAVLRAATVVAADLINATDRGRLAGWAARRLRGRLR